MKRILAIGLLLASSQAAAALLGSQSDAVECGPTMRAATIDQMKLALSEANAKALQHFNALNEDLGRRKKTAAALAETAEADVMAQELGGLIDVMQAGDDLRSALESASLLAAIRDQTMYGGDKAAANARLSLSLFIARQEAEKAYRSISQASAKITRPDVAADVAKMRDAIEAVIRVLGSCKPPRQEVPGK